ncbi:Putative CDP-tyvelose-2-epimerase (RfbE) [Prochlorococcus marinus subsp. pastoris str. CCMP1986]|uniref:Putative CDP-tyvelose-2-epimerase (RfbE) n=1 Tax=Prochlorococcus marinus subsp. pastoris (strain CCMP1986 / NIES-2087 / MED4) TaxID=59919 RepID=Q7V0Q5_PROMP|nr:NAD-dependent epimerase/dehydratase family protein [Prochlorococcus marinus]KGF87239.1 CDP-tyvelose-2-epimerase [Prochlorococcus marinus str. EQPAC1]CAE19660.1 Putative CDP-tyvelose-2-epimerase (RfbE) [Prochlorococcus marinus subsp. pastoris str. CCMP1986]
MKILITGGCGFLGSNLSNFFLKKNYEVFIIDSLVRRGSDINLSWLKNSTNHKNLKNFQIDIKNKNKLENIFEVNGPFDYICHVAGQVAMTTSLKDPRTDLETNLIGTFNVLEAMRKYSPHSLLAYSSTNKVYGDLGWLNYKEMSTRFSVSEYPEGFNENLPLDFSTPYGCSKGSADQYVRDWARIYGLKTVVFRHSSIYGGRQYASKDQGWIGWFCKKAIEQKKQQKSNQKLLPFTISGSGKQVRDVLHADDLVNLYEKAFFAKEKLNGEIFNIGGGLENSLSLLELFNLLSELLDIEQLSYNKLPRRQSDQDFFVASIKKAKIKLGWEPKINYKKGIKDMISWTSTLI